MKTKTLMLNSSKIHNVEKIGKTGGEGPEVDINDENNGHLMHRK
jgi:hypothetical protein